ncbi:MAG TPA: hypothetical protein PL065_04830, partial [Polyangiaceae bacterium]|nr:hypothetical protein [Polyangiaceae bacterium]
MKQAFRLVAFTLLPGLVGCAGGTHSIVFGDIENSSEANPLSVVQQHLSRHGIANGANVVVGVMDRGIVGLGLDSHHKWFYPHPVNGGVWITGQIVVAGDGKRFTAMEAATGNVVWEQKGLGQIRGASDDGQSTLVWLTSGPKTPGILQTIDRRGHVHRTIDVPEDVGIPAMVGNVGFVPWRNRFVSLVDFEGPKEIARFDQGYPTALAWVMDQAVYVGRDVFTRYDDRITTTGIGRATTKEIPKQQLVDDPTWFPVAGIAGPITREPIENTKIFAKPTPQGATAGYDGQRYYASNRRIVLGLRDDTGELVWVRRLEANILAGAAFEGGVVLCDRAGNVQSFEGKTGALAEQVSLGTALRACVIQVDRFSKPAAPRPKPLVEQLSEAIDGADASGVKMQGMLVRELGKQPSALATERLIDLAFDSKTLPELMVEVRDGISGRRNGQEAMLAALSRRYDYLAGVLMTPPVGPLADALAAMKEGRAAPLLAEHLNDPANRTDDVKRAALALEVLATEAEREPLETFFALYRATAYDDDMTQA